MFQDLGFSKYFHFSGASCSELGLIDLIRVSSQHERASGAFPFFSPFDRYLASHIYS
jgi:hypothetical protein